MSFTSPGRTVPQPEKLRDIDDARALRALAHPLRLALLNHLMAFGEQTASQCARVVDATASNCSYHLRSLAKFGLVEAVESTDGRESPWRTTATGFRFGPRGPGTSPAVLAAEDALTALELEADHELTRRAVVGRHTLPDEWQQAARVQAFALRLSAAELQDLGEKLDALIRPYIGLTRSDAPADAEVAVIHLAAFRHPDAA